MSPASAILRKCVYVSLDSIKRCRRSCGLTKSVMLTHDARLRIVIPICRLCYAQMTQKCDKMLCIYVLFSHYMIVFSFARPTCIQNVYDGFTFYCRNKTFAKYIISFYSKSLLVQIQYMNPVNIKKTTHLSSIPNILSILSLVASPIVLAAFTTCGVGFANSPPGRCSTA